MFKTLVVNNSIAIGVHALLCGMTLLLVIAPLKLEHTGSVLLSIACTVVFLLLYYLSGRFILRDTRSIWLNLVSVAFLAVVILFGLTLASSEVILLPFYPAVVTLSYSDAPKVILQTLFVLMPVLPSLAMWLGITTKRAS